MSFPINDDSPKQIALDGYFWDSLTYYERTLYVTAFLEANQATIHALLFLFPEISTELSVALMNYHVDSMIEYVDNVYRKYDKTIPLREVLLIINTSMFSSNL